MSKLKGVIFGVENVLVKPGQVAPHADTLKETARLVAFLKSKGVESVVMTNKAWTATVGNPEKQVALQTYIEKKWSAKLHWFQCAVNGVPAKQSGDSIKYVRDQFGWQPNETLFIGNTDIDMQASVNGKILLLNAEWYEKNMDYGFGFESPKDVARFIDTFCFRDHLWYFQIDREPLRVYSLAPLGSYFSETKYYSEDFLGNIKKEFAKDQEFWTRFLCTSMYFSGIYEGVSYITAYPKHSKGEYPEVLVKAMTTFAKCFRKSYIPDLIVRHTTAVKSQFNRDSVDHQNQLSTIHLNPFPSRIVSDEMTSYKHFPVKTGKSVLVIDDICTKGMSFEAARTMLSSIGAQTICVSFLKALKHDYQSLTGVTLPNGAFQKNVVKSVGPVQTYSLQKHIVDKDAPAELTDRLKGYQNWDWPEDI